MAVEQRATEAYLARFGSRPRVVATAPGRVNLIGEHTDYNGGFVLPCAIGFRVAAAVGEGAGGLYSVEYGETRSSEGCADGSWASYPRGVAWALAESGYDIPRFQAAFHGDVPRGAGLSSSAAIEGATVLALAALNGLDIDRRQLAVLCQRAENGYVGIKSGIMDQYASLLCRAGSALLIDCRTLEAQTVPVDLAAAGLTLLVGDTGVARAVATTGYNERRATCERAAQRLGVEELRDANLGDLSRLSGEELKRARHVVSENERVLRAVDALTHRNFTGFGRLMTASHNSLRDDYEVSTPELDAFVDTALTAGALGARLTGAGFGGSAIALIETERAERLRAAVTEQFAAEGFGEPTFFRCIPSDGATVVAPPPVPESP